MKKYFIPLISKSTKHLVAATVLASSLYFSGCQQSKSTRALNLLEESIRSDNPERKERSLKLLAESLEDMSESTLVNSRPQMGDRPALHEEYSKTEGFKTLETGNSTTLFYGVRNLLPSELEVALEERLFAAGLGKVYGVPCQQLVSVVQGTNQLSVTLPNYDTPTNNGEINLTQTKALIKELDRVKPQVAINIMIAEVARDDSLDLRMMLDAIYSKNPDYVASIEAKFPGASDIQLAQLGGVGGITGSYITEGLGYILQATFSALDSRQRAITLNDSVFQTASGSRVTSGKLDERPIPQVIFGQQVSTTSFKYEKADTKIEITPYAMDDGRIILSNLVIDVAAFRPSETVPPRTLKSLSLEEITLNQGQALFLTGLREREEVEVHRQVPILGDIPFLGEAFKGRSIEKRDTEFYVLLIPHVHYPNGIPNKQIAK